MKSWAWSCSWRHTHLENRLAVSTGVEWGGTVLGASLFKLTQATEVSREVSLAHKDSHPPFVKPALWAAIHCSPAKGFSKKRANTQLCIQKRTEPLSSEEKPPPQAERARQMKRKNLVVAVWVEVPAQECHRHLTVAVPCTWSLWRIKLLHFTRS